MTADDTGRAGAFDDGHPGRASRGDAIADRALVEGGPRDGTRSREAISNGALGLLRDCVGARAGERLLIVREPAGAGYYDAEVPERVERTARALGLRVRATEAPTALVDGRASEAFVGTLGGVDHVVFLARVGDQLRFGTPVRLPSATMCYALEGRTLDADFGTVSHAGLCAIRALVETALAEASEIRVSCPRGTDYRGRVAPESGPASTAASDTVLKRFPMLVPRAVRTRGFRGRVVLSRFLVGTGSHFYEPYSLPLAEDLVAHVEGDRLVRLEGSAEAVRRVNAHCADIGARYGADPRCVHSWHAGIHPACTFAGDARRDMLRWSGSAFGNPRLLHFHTCGDYAPGEISWNLLDPTVSVDGVALWEAGRLHPERLPGGAALLARHPRLAALYRAPRREVGLDG